MTKLNFVSKFEESKINGHGQQGQRGIAKLVLIVAMISVVLGCSSANGEPPGLAVGKKAPDFSLENQLGKEVSLAQLTKDKNVALVFYRSADW